VAQSKKKGKKGKAASAFDWNEPESTPAAAPEPVPEPAFELPKEEYKNEEPQEPEDNWGFTTTTSAAAAAKVSTGYCPKLQY
jgi:hypothetical protein